ncbi:MAG: hypothetical protein O2U62_05375 [Candidatus Bathyarchaeota archaeon]|jgi:NAD-dependent SIR2 family protein deacetylase|nr:hypothetical protein [Candidatus Bathyarchaeota archaeon]
MRTRRCERCGTDLTDEDVMKIRNENGSWETIPLPLCPSCFTKQMQARARETLVNESQQEKKLKTEKSKLRK